MKMPHPYVPNGLGARDENGNVPCAICGYGPGAHVEKKNPDATGS